MRILSYNVNGIRAALNKGLRDWLLSADADVFCIQETKARPDQVDAGAFEGLGFTHKYWHSAIKKGYSGVAIFSKEKPDYISYGMGDASIDAEGRVLRVDFSKFSVMSLYLPSGTNPARLQFKFDFMDRFLDYVNQLRKTHPNLIICGDFNICHRAIDIHDPVRNVNVSGFLPQERDWLSRFLASGFVDTFRHKNPDAKDRYSWWSYRAASRARNKGWRIDYQMATPSLISSIAEAEILDQAVHSDHCPTLLDIG